VKITRTLMFLVNMARVMPVNPIMLIDATHQVVEHKVVERDVALAIEERPATGGATIVRVAEAL
jgi:hypothetical protein